jgi:hypothetical protein
MTNLSININENNEEIIVKNLYFIIFFYDEYVKDTYKTNVKIHFENILKDNGFILSSIGSEKTICKEENYKLKEAVDDINNDLFDKYVNGSTDEKTKLKYDRFNNTIKLLNLPDDNNIITKFESEIKNDDMLQDHFNFIKLFKSDEKNELKLIELKLNSYDVKTNKSIHNKIKIIRNIEEKYKLGFMNVAFDKKEVVEAAGANSSSLMRSKSIYSKIFNCVKTLFSRSTNISNDSQNNTIKKKKVKYHINNLIISAKFFNKIITSCEFVIDSSNDDADELKLNLSTVKSQIRNGRGILIRETEKEFELIDDMYL